MQRTPMFWTTCVFGANHNQCLEEDIGNKDYKIHWNQTWDGKVDHVFVDFWLLNSEAKLHIRLEQYGFPPTFLLSLSKNQMKTDYAKDIGDMDCKDLKNGEIHTLKFLT